MAKPIKLAIPLLLILSILTVQTIAFVPYTRPLWDMMANVIPSEDTLRILEHTPFKTIPKGTDTLALARADWKETVSEHVIDLDIPGIKKEDVKIEVEEDRVLRVSGEMKAEEEREDDKWHRAERITGKFWRQFRLPENADFDRIKAHLENGVLKIRVPKLAEEKKRQPKVIDIAEEKASGEDIKTTKSEM